MVDGITLQQTLHGYGDGHQLLASSVELSEEQKWQMLVLSDLSGAAFRDGFESYVTGYPIAGGGYYCFARTWFAPELPRSGCVWTHTLLIPDSSVAQISDFRCLSALWQRPELGAGLDFYKHTLQPSVPTKASLRIGRSLCASVLDRLYRVPSSTVVIASESSSPHEDLVFGILNQQWPRLRRGFRFCTGALSERDFRFDLLVMPPNVLRGKPLVAVDYAFTSEEAVNTPMQPWLSVAVDDLIASGSMSEFRRFLWKFGPDYSEGREVFQALSEIFFALFHKHANADDLLSMVAHYFPEPQASIRLKAELFGVDSNLWTSTSTREKLLRTLVFHSGSRSLPPAVSRIPDRAQTVVRADLQLATSIALAAVEADGDGSREFLQGFFDTIKAAPYIVSSLPLPLLYELLRRNPEASTNWELWRRPAADQLAIAGRLLSAKIGDELGSAAIDAALTAGALDAVTLLLGHFNAHGVLAALRWFDSENNRLRELPHILRHSLGEHRDILVSAIRAGLCGPRALRVASMLLDPRGADVRSLGPDVWVPVATPGDDNAWMVDDLRSCAFFLSLGLFFREKEAAALVGLGFSAVYEAAKRNCIGDYLWGFVDEVLPWYIVYWDRCARLVRGVVKLFLRNSWPESAFLATFVTEEQVMRAFDESRKSPDGLDLIRRICEAMNGGTLTVRRDLRQVLYAGCNSLKGGESG